MADKYTAIQRVSITPGGTVEVKADFSTQLDRKNGQLLKAGSTPTVSIVAGTAANVTISQEQVNASRVWIDPHQGPPPRQADVGEVAAFRAVFAATLADTVYVAKVVAVDNSDLTLPARWIVFLVESAPTS